MAHDPARKFVENLAAMQPPDPEFAQLWAMVLIDEAQKLLTGQYDMDWQDAWPMMILPPTETG